MWQYILLIFVPILIQHVKIKGSVLSISIHNRNREAMQLFWGMLLLLLIFRHENIGRDLKTYKYIFTSISERDWQYAIERSAEVGYNILNKLVSIYSQDFRWILVITSIMGVVFVANAYVKYSNDATLTIILFINMSNFVMLFSGLRQCIAISIGFLAFEFVKKKRIFSFIVVVVIAMLFHTSAFMLFFMYPLYYMKITRKWMLGVIPLLGIIWVFNKQIFGTLALILSMFTKYNAEVSATGAYSMLLLFIVFTIFVYIIPEEDKLDCDTKGFRNFLLFSVMLQMFASIHELAMRMNYYYIVFIPLLIPRIINYRDGRWKQVAKIARNAMIIFFIIYFFLTAPRDDVVDIFPYKFMWENG